MADIRFYHLTVKPFAQALPAILAKALSTGRRAVVLLNGDEEVRFYDDLLWTYNPDSFLAHGTRDDGSEASHPVFLTSSEENPNAADMLVLFGKKDVPSNISGFSLCCDFLDGQNEQDVLDARNRWKAYKNAGHAVTYWQQSETGAWEQKA